MQVDCWWQHRNSALLWRAWFRNWTNEDLMAALEAASLPGVDNFDCSHWTTVSSSPWREVMLQSECCPEDAPEDSKPSVRATATLLSDRAVAVMRWNKVDGAKQVSVARELTWTFGGDYFVCGDDKLELRKVGNSNHKATDKHAGGKMVVLENSWGQGWRFSYPVFCKFMMHCSSLLRDPGRLGPSPWCSKSFLLVWCLILQSSRDTRKPKHVTQPLPVNPLTSIFE